MICENEERLKETERKAKRHKTELGTKTTVRQSTNSESHFWHRFRLSNVKQCSIILPFKLIRFGKTKTRHLNGLLMKQNRRCEICAWLGSFTALKFVLWRPNLIFEQIIASEILLPVNRFAELHRYSVFVSFHLKIFIYYTMDKISIWGGNKIRKNSCICL